MELKLTTSIMQAKQQTTSTHLSVDFCAVENELIKHSWRNTFQISVIILVILIPYSSRIIPCDEKNALHLERSRPSFQVISLWF